MMVVIATISCFQLAMAQSTLRNCSYPAVYGFGDSLSDTGNSIAAFPDKFVNAARDPNGAVYPTHAADRFSDGKQLFDYLAFGVRSRPIYPVLRGTAADFTVGTNFAAAGASARKVKVWVDDHKFNVPFSLDTERQWYERYKVRLWFYESPVFNNGRLVLSLPKLATVNESLFMVWAGHHDYFFSLYDKTLSPSRTRKIVPDVVAAIEDHLDKLLTPVTFTPPGFDTFFMPTATQIFVVNLPPLGCNPAMLTMYGSANEDYDDYGCLIKLNKISSAHNKLLKQKVDGLRIKYPKSSLVFADAEGVYLDILKDPMAYNISSPLKACCGYGGLYNFNTKVTCGHAGTVNGKFVNLTMSTPAKPCENPGAHISWDGVHTSDAFNKAAVTAFLTGKHIDLSNYVANPCNPDFSNF